MKHPQLLFVLLIALFSCNNQEKQITLINNQTTDYTIVVSEDADSLTHLAAQELQSYIHKVSNTKLLISFQENKNTKNIFVGKELLKKDLILSELDKLKEDAFIIDINDENIVICGSQGQTNLYAAYTFIEDILGCLLLSSSEEFIPKMQTINLPITKKTYTPAFAFRRTLLPGMFNEKYRNWYKLENLDEWGSFVHTFQHLIPPDKYFEEHPEYFSLLGNKRLSDAQLCLSNPEVINTLIENLRKKINQKPKKKYWSVSQNDCYNYCECDKCKNMYKKYGGISGAYIFMANEIAKAFPDKEISTLAYQFTRSTPTNIIPAKNVNIMFCSIECNRSMPLENDVRSKSFVKDMEDWSKISNNFFIWDYVVQFKNYLTLFPNFHVLQPNIQFFKKFNVNMMFQQGSSRN